MWANDAGDRRLVAIDPNGDVTVVDKGTGGGVTDSTTPEPSDDPSDDPETPAADTPSTGATPPPTDSTPPTDATPPSTATPDPVTPAAPEIPAAPAAPTTVTVPAVSVGTPYEQVCAAIQAAQLRCTPASAGTDFPGETGDTVSIDPKPGSTVAAGSNVNVGYIGQLRVTRVVGLDATSACRAVESQGLTCKETDDPNPVALKDLTRVTAQNPSAGDEIDKGGEVTVSVPRRYTVPNLAGAQAQARCDFLARYGITCTTAAGTPGNTTDRPQGTVYDQTPARGTAAAQTDPVTVTYYSGTSTPVGDYVTGAVQNQSQAQVDRCNADGVAGGWSCQLATGGPPTDNRADLARTVYNQDVTVGQTVPVGTVITVYEYGDQAMVVVPAAGGGVDGAGGCLAMTNAGLGCVNHPEPGATPTGRDPNPVTSQSIPPNTSVPAGTQIDLGYFPGAARQVFLWANPTGNVTILRFEGDTDPDYPVNRGSLGWIYQTPVPNGGPQINGFICGANSKPCPDGRPVNHFYSLLTEWDPDHWVNPPTTFGFGAPCGANSTGLWRVWSGDPGAFDYSVVQSPPNANPKPNLSEYLGCAWL